MPLTMDEVAVVNCANCTVQFCITKTYETRRRGDNKDFYCPNGHANVYSKPKGDSPEVKKLKERIAQLEAELAEARKNHYDPAYVAFLEDHPDGYVREKVTADG